MKINILGTEYDLVRNIDPGTDHGLDDRFGYCNYKEKRVVIADIRKIESWEKSSDTIVKGMINETLRHEIIHAFLYESGLWGSSAESGAWAVNEEMIDWFALQLPKICKAFAEAGCTE